MEGSFSRDNSFHASYFQYFNRRTTTAPSRKTDYVIIGLDAGPKKLETIKKLGIKTLTEDEYLNLIGTRKGVLDDKAKAAIEKEEEKIRQAAKDMDKQEKLAAKASTTK